MVISSEIVAHAKFCCGCWIGQFPAPPTMGNNQIDLMVSCSLGRQHVNSRDCARSLYGPSNFPISVSSALSPVCTAPYSLDSTLSLHHLRLLCSALFRGPHSQPLPLTPAPRCCLAVQLGAAWTSPTGSGLCAFSRAVPHPGLASACSPVSERRTGLSFGG